MDSIAVEDSTSQAKIVYMTLPKEHYTKDVGIITVTIVNDANDLCFTGYDYVIERWVDGQWTNWPLKHPGVDEVALGIWKEKPLKIEVDLSNVQNEYVKGTYRLGKPIDLNMGDAHSDGYCYCVFYIDE